MEVARMSRLEVGIGLIPDAPVHQVASWARLCEASGLDFVGVADAQMLWPDLYVVLGQIAGATSRIRLGPWVTNPVTRHPTVTANAIATIDALSGGRAFLGIGNGDGAVRTIGSTPARFAELAAAIAMIGRLCRGEEVETPAGRCKLATARGALAIYWAAADARSLVCGGGCADGVIVSGWLVPGLLDRAREHIAEGARSAGRDPAAVEAIFNTGLSIDDDRARALDAAKPYVARALARTSSTWLPDWTEEDMQRFRSQYDYQHHFRADHELAALVPDHMVQRKAVAGTPEECCELIRRVRDRGYTKLGLFPMGDLETNVRLLTTRVLPRL
jgi:5,10-methylenetetrahydromethanopterin reductase